MSEPSLRELAEDAGVYMPLLADAERVGDDRFSLVIGTWPHVNVWRLRVGDGETAAVVGAVRATMRERGKPRALWWLGEAATPADLPARLEAEGVVPDPDAPVLAAMVLTEPPRAVDASLRIEVASTVDEYRAAREIDWECMQVAQEDRAAMRAVLPEHWETAERDGPARYYLAYDGDQPVASARALFGERAVFLHGGATLLHARGRGAYGALVNARWRDAVAAGTPRLVVQATEMSAPILARLGFERVGEIKLYADRL